LGEPKYNYIYKLIRIRLRYNFYGVFFIYLFNL